MRERAEGRGRAFAGPSSDAAALAPLRVLGKRESGRSQGAAPERHSYPLQVIGWPSSPTRQAVKGRLLLIHGMEETWEVWRPLGDALAAGWDVMVLDLPWSGRQGYDWRFSRVAPAEWIERGLGLLPATPDVVVAHSFGAMALLDYLDVHGSGPLAEVVLVSPFYLPPHKPFDWQLMDRYYEAFPRFLEEAVNVRQHPRVGEPEVTAAVAEIIRQKIGPAGSIEFLQLYSRTSSFRLERVQARVVIVSGDRDFFTSYDDCLALKDRVPRGVVRQIPNCGHFSMLEQTAALADIIGAGEERPPAKGESS